ncbi:ATP-dependent RecD-like DNA helicase [bacterium]|nr:ATP-dependent RecD-like DNA helicase [bacterium]NBX78667.1 ATP-dependent RecD-like DNA helicase [bacterium]
MDQTTEHISGVVDKIVYESTDTGYTVFVLLHKQEPYTITGTFHSIQPGQQLHIQGSWKYHPKFGKQFIASNYTSVLPSSVVGLKKYLGSGLIKGIGPIYANKLVDYFKEETLSIIDQEPQRLYEVPGIGKKRVEQIISSWIDQKYIAHIIVFLQEKGVSTTYATKIYKTYGKQSIALLTENPYRLTDDIWGIGFKTADDIAQKLGFAKNSLARIASGVLFALSQANSVGHLYQEVDAVKHHACELLELNLQEHNSLLKQALTNLYNNDKIKLISYNEKHFITTSILYHTEKGVATRLQTLLDKEPTLNLDIQKIYTELDTHQKIQLHEQQIKGIIGCLTNKISIITGGPGTGKTTLISCLLEILERHNIAFTLAAPTGRAAKRMMEGTKKYAQTIHRLLAFDPGTMQFSYNEKNALKTDFLIIDEASMIDIFLANAIIKAVPHHAHVIFIGDTDQLPSVGPGNFLHDLIASKKVSFVRLEHIFRQAQNSMIIVNAHKINHGDFPTGQMEGCKKDFYFIKQEDPTKAFETITKILQSQLKIHHISPENATILVPMNKGSVGTHTLNHQLQQLLNPGQKPHASFAGTQYKVGDRVMQIKNNYDKKIFNGDIGTITSIDTSEQILLIQFDDRSVEYDFSDLSELVLAYAVTIHKSQGSEYDAIIVPIFTQHFTLLQRNLLYTAITRAKKVCFFVGQPRAVAMGIKNTKTVHRITFLEKFLTENIACT